MNEKKENHQINIGFIGANHYPRLGGMEFVNHFLLQTLNNQLACHASIACSTMPEIDKTFNYPYPCYRARSLSYLTPALSKYNQWKMIKEQSVNVLHGAMIHGGGLEAMNWSRRLSLPFVAHSHGSDVQVVEELGYGETLNPDGRKLVENVLRSADFLVAVSEINKRNMVELGAIPEKIAVVHNGIQYDEIQKTPFFSCRSKLNIDPDDFVLIAVGRNAPVKRMDLLFLALQKLKAYPSIKLLCVGPVQNIRKLVEKFNIREKVIFAGTLPTSHQDVLNPPYAELVNAYRAADVYVSTSYVEAFSLATIDALACGIPVIIGQKHGAQDIIRKGKTGWIMEKETPDELAEMILNCFNQRESLRNNVDYIKESVRWLTWDYVASEMLKIYKKVI